MNRRSIIKSITIIMTATVFTGTIYAEECSCPIIKDMLVGGTPKADLRLRYEDAKLEGAEGSAAFTLRTRLGYETKSWGGFQGYVEFENVTALNDGDNYNQAGLNGESNRTVIADIEGTELNQAYLTGKCEITKTTIRAGLQRIILDNARFVGNVGWRQNEQTYEAATIENSYVEGLDLFYGYVSGVNRIFGQENGNTPYGEAGNTAAFDSDAHLINVSYKLCEFSTATVYGYLLDLGEGTTAAALSSDTYGIRIVTAYECKGGAKTDLELEYASQSDNSGTTDGTDYTADYIRADLLESINSYGIGVGYELLGADDGVSFKTPLATAHGYNGWADLFLVTPANGLEDIYARAKATCPMTGADLEAVYHVFSSNEDSIDYGGELDVIVSKKMCDNVKLIAKYAGYRASSDDDNPAPNDVDRVWIQMDLTF